jgi:threonine aldolase
MRLDDIRSAIRKDDPHQPITRLITLENTHNRCGGAALTAEYTRAVAEIAHQHDLILHLDGARIFNAAVALEVEAAELAAPADSVTFCLSKGLSAPVGSVICGEPEFIHKAHRMRKQLGGGMRQAGILAAAGIVALETIVGRLEKDHLRARKLASHLKKVTGVVLDPETPHTNMVYIELEDQVPLSADQVAERLKGRGVRVGVVGPRRFRLVTHYWISDKDVEEAASMFGEVLNQTLI